MRYLLTNENRPNPGLKPSIREDLELLSQALSTWKNMSFSSGMNNYIVRRFAASRSGVYFSFPGSPVQGTDFVHYVLIFLKFIYSEKATKFCEISTNYLTGTT